jgi:hypothetical protein
VFSSSHFMEWDRARLWQGTGCSGGNGSELVEEAGKRGGADSVADDAGENERVAMHARNNEVHMISPNGPSTGR